MKKRKIENSTKLHDTKKKVLKSTRDESKADNTFRSIKHKQSNGCSNWMSFIASEQSKQGTKMTTESSKVLKKKPPLMKRLNDNNTSNKPFVFCGGGFNNSKPGKLTALIAIDCEMVGVGEEGNISILARVSIVNSLGECVYDKYVKPTDPVTDYRTHVSGIRPSDVENATDFHTVQSEVACILKGRILVGHSLRNDLDVLMLKHPFRLIRDTTMFSKFRSPGKGTMSLKAITEQFLNVKIQTDEHNSIEDARAAMQLYMTFRSEWEQERRENRNRPKNKKKQTKTEAPSNLETISADQV